MIGAKMKWVLATLLALALAGCADSGSFDREKPVALVAPTEQILPPTKPVRPKALTAKAEASKPEAAKESSLLECVSDACKAQCSLRIEKQSRPKWCLYFKEPIEQPAASAPSEQLKLGSS
jgi:hypothetical protein